MLGTIRERPRLLAGLLGVTLGLSLMDGGLTAFELSAGLAREGNPLLAHLVHIDPWAAAAFKVAVTVLVVAGVWNWRWYRSVIAVGVGALATYGLLVVFHLGALSTLGVL